MNTDEYIKEIEEDNDRLRVLIESKDDEIDKLKKTIDSKNKEIENLKNKPYSIPWNMPKPTEVEEQYQSTGTIMDADIAYFFRKWKPPHYKN